MENFNLQIVFQLCLAVFLGALVGLEREYKGKEAGLKTYSLVTLGTCLFTLISFSFFDFFFGKQGLTFDPSRIIQAVAIGIGFLGAGIIIFRSSRIEGLTTAAGLWVVAAIGIAIGAKFYFLAIFTTLLAIGILAGFELLEEKLLKKKNKNVGAE